MKAGNVAISYIYSVGFNLNPNKTKTTFSSNQDSLLRYLDFSLQYYCAGYCVGSRVGYCVGDRVELSVGDRVYFCFSGRVAFCVGDRVYVLRWWSFLLLCL